MASVDNFTEKPLVDWLTIVLWTTELSIRVIASVFALLSIAAIYGNRVFHANFRVLFSLILLRAPVHTVQRFGNITLRTFFADKGMTTAIFQLLVSLLSAFNTSFHVTALVLMSMERAVSVYSNAAWYDAHFQSRCAQFLLLLGTILLNIAIDFLLMMIFGAGGVTPVAYVACPAAVYLVTGMMWVVFYVLSRRRRRRRSARTLQIDNQLRALENIRATQLFLPCILNELAYSIVYFCLAFYSINYTPYEMGKDTTRLSHAYDYIGAYASVFQPVYVYFRHARFVRERQKFLAEFQRPEDKDKSTKAYFNELVAMWK